MGGRVDGDRDTLAYDHANELSRIVGAVWLATGIPLLVISRVGFGLRRPALDRANPPKRWTSGGDVLG